jgi:hypothetical protein
MFFSEAFISISSLALPVTGALMVAENSPSSGIVGFILIVAEAIIDFGVSDNLFPELQAQRTIINKTISILKRRFLISFHPVLFHLFNLAINTNNLCHVLLL